MRLTFPLDFGDHGLLLRFVRDMATLDTLIASGLFRVWNAARLWRHLVENVKRVTITLETLQGQSSVHQRRLLRLYGMSQPFSFGGLSPVTDVISPGLPERDDAGLLGRGHGDGSFDYNPLIPWRAFTF
jgi:hypothetical protein